MTDRAIVSGLENESRLKKRKQDKLVFVDAVEQIIRDSMWSSVLYRAMPLAVAGISIHAAITARPFLFKRPDNFRSTAIKLILQSFFIGTSLYVIGRLSSKPSTDAKLRAAGFKTEDGSWTPHAYKLRDLSVNEEYAPRQNDGKCGYCKSEGRDRVTHGMWVHNLSVADYQGLLDRGWRRSGKYCYKPVLNQICCPQYTIRCRIEDFKASKSQRKTLNALLHFLKDDKEHANKGRPEKVVYSKDHPFVPPVKLPVSPENSSGDGLMRGREKRRMRKRRKLLSKGIDPAKNPRSTLQQRSLDSIFEEIFCSTTTATRKLTVETMRSCPESDRFKETFHESYKLAVKYQKIIHKEDESDWTVNRYRNFLVECPLPPQKSSHSQHPGYGAFHQHYRLNGNLIAVGVIDILPSCVSSKYLYYDPAYSHLSLGTVSALHEIYYTRILHGYTANLRYYYMGYYIHMNQKMKYKGNYAPSDLLCPETYAWISIETCRKKLDIQKYCKFSDDESETTDDSASVSEADLAALQRLLFMNKLMSYSEYEALRRVANKELTADEKNDLVDYVRLVGRRLANRMINCVD